MKDFILIFVLAFSIFLGFKLLKIVGINRLPILDKSSDFINIAAWIAVFSALIFAIFFTALWVFWFKDSNKKIIRGAKITTPFFVRNALKKYKNRIVLGKEKIPVPFDVEPKGWLIVGEQGSGKTNAIFSITEQILKNNNKDLIIFYDTKPDFVPTYFNPKKHANMIYAMGSNIENKAFTFQIFKEIENEKDVDFIVNCIIVEEAGEQNATSSHFMEQAKILMKATLLTVFETCENPSNIELIDFLLEHDTTQKFVEKIENEGVAQSYGLAVSGILNGGKSDAQAASAWANFQKYCNKLKRREFYTKIGTSPKLDIRNWLKIDTSAQIYILNPAADQDSFSVWSRMILGCYSRAIRNLPNSATRRIWFILDEFQTLGKFPEIAEELPAQGRSKGACVVLATQNLAKLKAVYGESLSNAIVSAGATKIIGKVGDPYSLSTLERVFGDSEIEEFSQSEHNSMSGTGNPIGSRYSTSTSSRIRTQKVVMGSEIATQETGQFFLKLDSYITKIKFPEMILEKRGFEFVPDAAPKFARKPDSISQVATKNNEMLEPPQEEPQNNELLDLTKAKKYDDEPYF